MDNSMLIVGGRGKRVNEVEQDMGEIHGNGKIQYNKILKIRACKLIPTISWCFVVQESHHIS